MTKDIRRLGGWSHDIRTVAASLLSYADLYAVSACSKEQLLDGLRANCGWLLELVDGCAADQDPSIGVEEKPVPTMKMLVDSVIDSQILGIQTRQIRLSIDIDNELTPLAPSQVLVVKRILANLLSNAVRHSQSKEITIRVAQVVTSHMGEDKWCCLLEVQDFGRGIPRQQVKRIMQRDKEGLPSTPAQRRKGLGTVQSLAAALGGKFALQSQFGKGTRCSVEFIAGEEISQNGTKEVSGESDTSTKLDGPDHSLSARPDKRTRAPRRATEAGLPVTIPIQNNRSQDEATESVSAPYVLLIDDDPDLRELIAAVLHAEGIRTIAVPDEAVAMTCRLAEIDCVLLDLNLENARGCDVAKRLRGAGFARPILALTAEPITRSIDAAGRPSTDPFDGWIDKTEGGSAVANRLRQVLSNRRLASS